MKFDRIFLKFGKLTSNYITKLSTYARHNYEIFENFGAMLIFSQKERDRAKLSKISVKGRFLVCANTLLLLEHFLTL